MKRRALRGPARWALLALAGGPAQAQWNYYNNASNSFYVPFVAGGVADFRYVSLTLPYGSSIKTTAFVMDTGSLGILAGTNAYSPGAGDIPLGPGGNTYTSDGTSGAGNLFLTTVTINGQNGQTATARVPILQSLGAGGAQMGIGFARTGLQAPAGSCCPTSIRSWVS